MEIPDPSRPEVKKTLPVPTRPGTRPFLQVPDPSRPEVKKPYPSDPARDPRQEKVESPSSNQT